MLLSPAAANEEGGEGGGASVHHITHTHLASSLSFGDGNTKLSFFLYTSLLAASLNL